MLPVDYRKKQTHKNKNKNQLPNYARLAGWGQVGHCCPTKGHLLLYPKDTGIAQSEKQRHRKVFVGIKKSKVLVHLGQSQAKSRFSIEAQC